MANDHASAQSVAFRRINAEARVQGFRRRWKLRRDKQGSKSKIDGRYAWLRL
jgi:hypothetical protein